MQNMSWQYRGYGNRGGWGPHPGFFILPMIAVGFLFFVALKFFWPLLLLGLVFMVVRKAMIYHAFAHGGHGDWNEQQREWAQRLREHGGFGRGRFRGRPGFGGRPGFDPRGGFGERGDWRQGRRGPWGWDSNEDQPKRKNDDDSDDKPKRDGNTLYV